MRFEERPVSSLLGLSAIALALVLVLSSTLLNAQGDRPVEELTLDELQEQREILAAEAAGCGLCS